MDDCSCELEYLSYLHWIEEIHLVFFYLFNSFGGMHLAIGATLFTQSKVKIKDQKGV